MRSVPSLIVIPLALLGCGDPSCLRAPQQACTVAPACDALAFSCASERTELYRLTADDPLPISGLDALASNGDWVLANDHVVAVIDDLDHPHYVAPTGGTLLDLGTRGDDNDALRNLQQAIGVLPTEAFSYTEAEAIEEGPIKAVQFRGTLDGFPDVAVATRYEIRPCDQGIRVRTELVHMGDDPLSLWLIDGFYWGGREHLPFTPGAGFEHPPFGLTDLQTAFRDVPWMVGAAHAGDAASYGIAPCNVEAIRGFQSTEISAIGLPNRILQPRDWAIYERFVAVADGPSASGPADVLMQVRQQLFDEPSIEVSGQLVADDGEALGDMVRASVVVSGPDGPLTHVVPDTGGRFTFRAPPELPLSLSVEAFGLVVDTVDVQLGPGPEDLGTIPIPAAGTVTLDATIDGVTDHVHAFVYPSDEATEAATEATLYGASESCAPLLGNPWGGSPACNRVLLDGPVELRLPGGTYDFVASVGPFSTLALAQGVQVEPGTGQSVLLQLQTLPLQPEGTLSADFHAHGRVSFDSSLPDLDRVRAFLASRVDVVASTDHDAVNDYAEAIEALGAGDRLAVRVGMETTGHILFPFVPDTTIPKVIGHFNFWPLDHRPRGPWRGGPWDELAEPGQLFTRVEQMGWPRETGVIQLNHPWGGLQFGRDFAWPTAIGLDLTQPLPTEYDGTGPSLFLRTPEDATFSNADFHAQEVMNGTNNAAFQQYRAIWHYLLSEGVVRAGTANSDSHSLTDNVLGTPRTLVWTDTTLNVFDPVVFDRAVRQGRMIGTNGPVIELATTDADGELRGVSLEPLAPDADVQLQIRIAAAPWVPVGEVRIVVNGEIVEVFDDLVAPPDPLSGEVVVWFNQTLSLADLLPDSGDAWLIVEAGAPLVDNADLDCDGVPDTGDNNGDGRIDWADVEDLDADPETTCFDTTGPLAEPPLPERGAPGWWFERVTPGGAPTAFTNPLLIDRGGDGYQGVPR